MNSVSGHRGMDQLVFALEDVMRGVELGKLISRLYRTNFFALMVNYHPHMTLCISLSQAFVAYYATTQV